MQTTPPSPRRAARSWTALTLSMLVLAACAPPAPPPVVDLAPRCGAPGLQGLIGQEAGVIGSLDRTGPLRVVHPGDGITEDYRPDRLNIGIGEDGLISRVWCG